MRPVSEFGARGWHLPVSGGNPRACPPCDSVWFTALLTLPCDWVLGGNGSVADPRLEPATLVEVGVTWARPSGQV